MGIKVGELHKPYCGEWISKVDGVVEKAGCEL